ncbi:MAG TPA: ABC transporter permease [Tepidisphaeraceae bacterium]|jgi:lipopolysaccharide transport system permease protein
MQTDVTMSMSKAPLTSADAPQSDAGELPVTVIEARSGWQPINVRELWQFRELLYFLTWRDVKVRYKQTLLGAAWAVLQPAMMMVVFTVFFGKMAKVSSGSLPYPVFAYLGLVPWTFFATSMANAGNSVVGSERLITKIYFPRLAIPFAAVGAAVVDFLIAFALLVVLMFWYGIYPGANMLLLPVVFLPIMLTALGVGTLLAALNVAYRDFRYVIPFLTQLWMFATPTVYMQPDASSGGTLKALLALNPLTGLISGFRTVCCGGAMDWTQWGIAAAFSAVVFLVGCLTFRRMERNFADII